MSSHLGQSIHGDSKILASTLATHVRTLQEQLGCPHFAPWETRERKAIRCLLRSVPYDDKNWSELSLLNLYFSVLVTQPARRIVDCR